MANDLESAKYAETPETPERRPGWLRLGLVAMASALAGGVAAAWWYRKTLNKLHESGENRENPQFGISDGSGQDDA
jgi:ferric-dicitrate binding protein FerR (iron transport regulator)